MESGIAILYQKFYASFDFSCKGHSVFNKERKGHVTP
jgi:hypothetical protein